MELVTTTTTNLEFSIDWLSFTIPKHFLQDCYNILKDTPVPNNTGFRGYQCSAQILNKGKIAWSRNRYDAHINLPSSSLHLMDKGDTQYILSLLNWIYNVDGHLTRIDFAYDNKNNIAKITDIEKAIINGNIVSRWSKWKPDGSYNIGEPAINGGTIYIGSQKSNSFLRVYDKAKEREVNENWIRFELCLKKNVANSYAKLLLNLWKENNKNKFIETTIGILRSFIEFKNKNSNKNSSRRKPLKWWYQLVGDINKVRISNTKEDNNIIKINKWINEQVAPSLAIIQENLKEQFPNWLAELLESGKKRWGIYHKNLLKG